MRAYSASSEEALRARSLIRDWTGEGFLTEAQRQRMESDTVCEFRRTNIFLRLVLFLFTLIITGAAVGLFFAVVLPRSPAQTKGVFLLLFAGAAYGAAEFAVSEYHLYRYGIEEALAACSVGFLCAGLQSVFFSGRHYSQPPERAEFLVPAAGAVLSLWIWRRFGLPYAFPAAMIFVVFLPRYWTSSHSAEHLIVAAFYTAGLTAVAAVRSRHRFEYLNAGYALVEAFLWLGIYLAINLQVSPLPLLSSSLFGRVSNSPRDATEFSTSFYWTSWVLIWCLPPAILARGVRGRDRAVIAAGAITAVLTLITNKPYLGWQRHEWDPMLPGALLVAVAVFLRRWLDAGPDGIRHNFTARRLSGNDKRLMNAGSAVFSLLSPHSVMPGPPTGDHDVRFGGGDSAGGGASSDF